VQKLTISANWLRAESLSKTLTEALDTTTAQGRLVFHRFGALAEFERSLIPRAHPSGPRSRGVLTAPEAGRRNSLTTTSRLPRRCSPIPISA
jgi:DNA invertase Pin-like site-specific DNA recombinase